MPRSAPARVADVVVAPAPFSAADGLLTSNGRPRRDAILHRYADAIARHYEPSLADETSA